MMEQTWRWFGPDDVVKISDICQTGATGVVTSLHHIPYGEVWTVDEIRKRQKQIADDSRGALSWSVVESLPVSDAIKLGEGDLEADFGNYRQSLRNLAACGITTICYNFMPVIDWTRTDLSVPLPGGARTLRFDVVKCAAFDCFILKRRGAEDDYGSGVVDDARRWIDASTLQQRSELFRSIMVGLPGAFKRYEIDEFSDILKVFSGLGRNGLLANLRRFLKEVVPTAEEVGARLAIHPDDPPQATVRTDARDRRRGKPRPCRYLLPVAVQRHHSVHGFSRRGAAKRPVSHRPALRRTYPFRAFAECEERAERLLQRSAHPGRRCRYARHRRNLAG